MEKLNDLKNKRNIHNILLMFFSIIIIIVCIIGVIYTNKSNKTITKLEKENEKLAETIKMYNSQDDNTSISNTKQDTYEEKCKEYEKLLSQSGDTYQISGTIPFEGKIEGIEKITFQDFRGYTVEKQENGIMISNFSNLTEIIVLKGVNSKGEVVWTYAPEFIDNSQFDAGPATYMFYIYGIHDKKMYFIDHNVLKILDLKTGIVLNSKDGFNTINCMGDCFSMSVDKNNNVYLENNGRMAVINNHNEIKVLGFSSNYALEFQKQDNIDNRGMWILDGSAFEGIDSSNIHFYETINEMIFEKDGKYYFEINLGDAKGYISLQSLLDKNDGEDISENDLIKVIE